MQKSRTANTLGLTLLLSLSASPAFANEAPVAKDLQKTLREDKPANILLKGSDADKDALTFTISQAPSHGTLSPVGNSGKRFKYTPAANYHGTDSFTYTANDGALDSQTATVTLTVKSVNDRPVAEAKNQTVLTTDPSFTFSLSASDIDGDELTYKLAARPKYGKVVINANYATYTPKAKFKTGNRTDKFKFKVKDSKKTSKPVLVSLTITDTPYGEINDTAVTQCANASQNNMTCPITNFASQDAEWGRDVAAGVTDDNGVAGFVFTKLDSDGTALTIQNAGWSDEGSEAAGTQWSCVKDETTGLTWEIKTNDGGLQDKDNVYTWYQTDASNDGGDSGQNCSTNGCTTDTKAYVAAINAQALCGKTDWRLPTVAELSDITLMNGATGAIDSAYFPEGQQNVYWTSSPLAASSSMAWAANFASAYTTSDLKANTNFVRLVRSGP
ncbi:MULTISPECIES: Ig-like domain-containing protein [Methylomonas]|uniref:Ig-like domain-containing protein n=1 Tax=Methylomonas TaxID=416 RepID=UPI001680F21A|nr:Ig-like domain-containing protein [Methylomonas rhizoryzae]